jgi:hypothetical protein
MHGFYVFTISLQRQTNEALLARSKEINKIESAMVLIECC